MNTRTKEVHPRGAIRPEKPSLSMNSWFRVFRDLRIRGWGLGLRDLGFRLGFRYLGFKV